VAEMHRKTLSNTKDMILKTCFGGIPVKVLRKIATFKLKVLKLPEKNYFCGGNFRS
jgi:hypothetical protein